MADEELEITIKVNSDEAEEAVNDDTPVKEIAESVGGEGGQDTIVDEAKYHAMFGSLQGAGGIQNMLGQAKGAASSPAGFMSNIAGNFAQNLGFIKNFSKAIPYVGLVIMALEIVPIVIKTVIDQLTKAGSPFDKRFKRIMADERNAFLSRDEQRKRQIGLSPVIMTSITGFRNIGGVATTHTLKHVRDDQGMAAIGLRDKAGGLTG